MLKNFMLVLALAVPVGLCIPAVSAEPRVEDHLAEADLAWSRDDLAAAEAAFLNAVSVAGDGQAAARLAGFYLGQNRLQEAVERFQQAISLGLPSPQSEAKAFVGMGLAYLHLDSSDLAAAAFEEALRLDPSREGEIRPVLTELEQKQP